MNFVTYSLESEIQLACDLPAGAVFKVTADGVLEWSLGWRGMRTEDIKKIHFLKMEGSPNIYPVGAIDLATGRQYSFGEGMFRVQRVRSGEVGC